MQRFPPIDPAPLPPPSPPPPPVRSEVSKDISQLKISESPCSPQKLYNLFTVLEYTAKIFHDPCKKVEQTSTEELVRI